VYPKKPPLPAVGGNEGVGEVIAVGPNVSRFRVGDRVIPAFATWGTWRSHAIGSENQFLRVSSELSVESAASIAVNPCTAYRMLSDFVTLAPGATYLTLRLKKH
jgi:trans-2-enoyl-CoA reductase